MATEDGPESMRRSTRTTDQSGVDEDQGADEDDSTNETSEQAERTLAADGEEATITMDGQSLVGVLNYLDDPQSYPGDSDALALQFERDADASQQNHVHEVFQVIHQVCKMADDSISVEAVELAPDEE